MEITDPASAAAHARKRMAATIDHLRRELAAVRTGRASVGILESVQVEAYGTLMPLNQVATLAVPDPTMVVATPFDPYQMAAIERGIRRANLGLNPTNDGKVLRIPFPPLTTERRRELSKLVHKLAEDGRNAVRQGRREANDGLKKLLKNHELGEDEERRALDDIQKITDSHIRQIDEIQKAKDTELLEQ